MDIDLTEPQIREVSSILAEKMAVLRRDVAAYKLIPKQYRSKRLRHLTKQKAVRLDILVEVWERFE
jgi:hypothetical protein